MNGILGIPNLNDGDDKSAVYGPGLERKASNAGVHGKGDRSQD